MNATGRLKGLRVTRDGIGIVSLGELHADRDRHGGMLACVKLGGLPTIADRPGQGRGTQDGDAAAGDRE
jgi:hypothetical protein